MEEFLRISSCQELLRGPHAARHSFEYSPCRVRCFAKVEQGLDAVASLERVSWVDFVGPVLTLVQDICLNGGPQMGLVLVLDAHTTRAYDRSILGCNRVWRQYSFFMGFFQTVRSSEFG